MKKSTFTLGFALLLLALCLCACSGDTLALKETDDFLPTASPSPTASPTPTPYFEPSIEPTVEASATPTPSVSPLDDKKAYIPGTSVNLRSEPSTGASVLASLGNNKAVVVTGEVDTWYRVEVDGKTGFVSKQFVKMGTAPTPTKKPTTKPSPTADNSGSQSGVTPPDEGGQVPDDANPEDEN